MWDTKNNGYQVLILSSHPLGFFLSGDDELFAEHICHTLEESTVAMECFLLQNLAASVPIN